MHLRELFSLIKDFDGAIAVESVVGSYASLT